MNFLYGEQKPGYSCDFSDTFYYLFYDVILRYIFFQPAENSPALL